MKAHDHNTNPKWEYKFKDVWIIKTKAILAHLIGTNKQSNPTYIDLFVVHNVYKYKS